MSKKNKIEIFKTKKDLISALSRSMPDEYPYGFAVFLADEWIKEGRAKIIDKD